MGAALRDYLPLRRLYSYGYTVAGAGSQTISSLYCDGYTGSVDRKFASSSRPCSVRTDSG
jgi:hypothetical protein